MAAGLIPIFAGLILTCFGLMTGYWFGSQIQPRSNNNQLRQLDLNVVEEHTRKNANLQVPTIPKAKPDHPHLKSIDPVYLTGHSHQQHIPMLSIATAQPLPFLNSSEVVCKAFWHQHFKTGAECISAAKIARPQLGNDALQELLNKIKSANLDSANNKTDALAIVYTIKDVKTLGWIDTHSRYIQSRWGNIPIEVHSEVAEVAQQCQNRFQRLQCVKTSDDLIKLVKESGHKRSHFAFKPMALIESRYRHVLFMDVDTVLLTSPSKMFTSQEYQAHGAIFFPDLWGFQCKRFKWGNDLAMCGQMGWPEHILWPVLGIEWKPTPSYAQEMDSGQLVVDTVRHHQLLIYTLLLATNDFVQNTVYGDKDCFRLSWLAHDVPFSYAPFPEEIGEMESIETMVFNRKYLLHFWGGEPAFLHQWKAMNEDLASLRHSKLPGTSLSASPLCYDACDKLDTGDDGPLDKRIAISLRRWIGVHKQKA